MVFTFLLIALEMCWDDDGEMRGKKRKKIGVGKKIKLWATVGSGRESGKKENKLIKKTKIAMKLT